MKLYHPLNLQVNVVALIPISVLRGAQVDFLAETDHFIHALKEGLKSLVGGLELRGMDSATRESSECFDTRNFTQVRESTTDGISFAVVAQ